MPESKLIGGALLENRDKAAEASPTTHGSKDNPLFLISHGDQDMAEPFRQSEVLYAAPKKAGVNATFVPVCSFLVQLLRVWDTWLGRVSQFRSATMAGRA